MENVLKFKKSIHVNNFGCLMVIYLWDVMSVEITIWSTLDKYLHQRLT